MKTTDFLKEGHCAIADEAETMHKDHEVQMARSQLYSTAQAAIEIHRMLKGMSEMEGLEGWVQSKITLAADYLNKVRDYLQYEQASQAQEEMMNFVYEEADYALDNLINGDGLGLKIKPKKDEVPGHTHPDDHIHPEPNELEIDLTGMNQELKRRFPGGKHPTMHPITKKLYRGYTQQDIDDIAIEKLPDEMKNKYYQNRDNNTDGDLPYDWRSASKDSGKKIGESASAGGTGAGAVATSMGGGNGFKNGGPGTLKRIKEQEFKNSAKKAFTKEHKVK
jgi:hypothetical protein